MTIGKETKVNIPAEKVHFPKTKLTDAELIKLANAADKRVEVLISQIKNKQVL